MLITEAGESRWLGLRLGTLIHVAGKFKVQNPKFKQTPKLKQMNHAEQARQGLSFGIGSFV
jgi:hypothetical protein